MGTKRILAATAAGIALGMLIAPEKGSHTREKIGDALDKLKDKWNDIRSLKNMSAKDLKELKEVFTQHITGLSDDVRKKILQIIESVKPAEEKMQEEPA